MWPLAGFRHEPGANRVQGDVTHCVDEVLLIHGDRAEAALEKMPGPARPRVDEAGVEAMRSRQRQRQPVRVGGSKNEVDVVGHLTIGPNFDGEAPAAFGEPVAIQRVVVVGEKDPLATVPALGDMVGNVGNDDAGNAGHSIVIAEQAKRVKAGGVDP